MTEDGIAELMAFLPGGGVKTPGYRQALFLRMFEEFKVLPIEYPHLTFYVTAPVEVKYRWFDARSLPVWQQPEGAYDGTLYCMSTQDRQAMKLFDGPTVDDQLVKFTVQAPLMTWLRWIRAHKDSSLADIRPFVTAVSVFVQDVYPNVWYAWEEYTKGVYLTREETEELIDLLGGQVVSPRLYHKLTGESL